MKLPLSFLTACFSLICLVVHPDAALSADSVDLLPLAAWVDSSTWAQAGDVQGSAQEMKWKSVTPGDKLLYNGEATRGITKNITSKESFGDVEIEVEFMIPKGSNSGIYLMSRYELQIIDSYGRADNELTVHDCGAIYEQWDASKPKGEQGFGGTRPSTNATSAPGTWQSFRILFRAPRIDASGKKVENARFIRVEHNGVTIHEDAEVPAPTRGGAEGPEVATAPLIVQGDHGPIVFRKLQVTRKKFD